MSTQLEFQRISSEKAHNFLVAPEAFLSYFLTPRQEEYSTYAVNYSFSVIANIFLLSEEIGRIILTGGRELFGSEEYPLSGEVRVLLLNEASTFNDELTSLDKSALANSNADRFELAPDSYERANYLEHCIDVVGELQHFVASAVDKSQAIIIYRGQ